MITIPILDGSNGLALHKEIAKFIDNILGTQVQMKSRNRSIGEDQYLDTIWRIYRFTDCLEITATPEVELLLILKYGQNFG